MFDDGRVKTASYDATEGFGLRAVRGETAGYAHSTELSARPRSPARPRPRGSRWPMAAARWPTRLRAPTSSSMATTIRSWAPSLLRQGRHPARDRRLRCARWTPASCRSAPRWPPPSRRSRSCAPRAVPSRTCAPDGPPQRLGHRRGATAVARAAIAGGGGRIGLEGLMDPRPLGGRGARGAAHRGGEPLGGVPAPGRYDGRGARPRLARHPAARGGRPRAGGRFQPQGANPPSPA